MLVTSYILHLRENLGSRALHTPPFSASLRSTLVRRFRVVFSAAANRPPLPPSLRGAEGRRGSAEKKVAEAKEGMRFEHS